MDEVWTDRMNLKWYCLNLLSATLNMTQPVASSQSCYSVLFCLVAFLRVLPLSDLCTNLALVDLHEKQVRCWKGRKQSHLEWHVMRSRAIWQRGFSPVGKLPLAAPCGVRCLLQAQKSVRSQLLRSESQKSFRSEDFPELVGKLVTMLTSTAWRTVSWHPRQQWFVSFPWYQSVLVS